MTDALDAADQPRPLNPDAYARYALHDRREILQLLQALVDRRTLVTAYLDDDLCFVTLLVAVTPDGAGVFLDAGPGGPDGRQGPHGGGVVCVTRLDNVRVQFALTDVRPAEHDGRPALRAALPDTVLRVQRREFFRLPAPLATPLTCAIAIDDGGRKRTVSTRILDISGGGLAIVVPPQDLEFVPGMEFGDCRLELPDGDVLSVRLKVRNLFDIERPAGRRLRRAGCEFVGLSAAVTARLQRYIFRLERDLNARRSGL